MENEVKAKNTVSIDWFIPWLAGYMFTIGLAANEMFTKTFLTYNWYEKIMYIILTYLTWPLFLGAHFAK